MARSFTQSNPRLERELAALRLQGFSSRLCLRQRGLVAAIESGYGWCFACQPSASGGGREGRQSKSKRSSRSALLLGAKAKSLRRAPLPLFYLLLSCSLSHLSSSLPLATDEVSTAAHISRVGCLALSPSLRLSRDSSQDSRDCVPCE